MLDRLAKSLRVVKNSSGGKTIFIDNDEFPWFTKSGVEKVQPHPHAKGVYYVTLTVVVDGKVEVE